MPTPPALRSRVRQWLPPYTGNPFNKRRLIAPALHFYCPLTDRWCQGPNAIADRCVGLLPIEVWRDERYSLQASALGKVERLLRRRASTNAGPVLGSARGNLGQPQRIPERVESKAGAQLPGGGHQRSTLMAKRGDGGRALG
jgi:hypothetical protein